MGLAGHGEKVLRTSLGAVFALVEFTLPVTSIDRIVRSNSFEWFRSNLSIRNTTAMIKNPGMVVAISQRTTPKKKAKKSKVEVHVYICGCPKLRDQEDDHVVAQPHASWPSVCGIHRESSRVCRSWPHVAEGLLILGGGSLTPRGQISCTISAGS
jgi:hypothetical protein